MSLKWTDINEIVFELCEKFPEVDPSQLRFTKLHEMICELPDFEDDPKRCNERVLESVIGAWMAEIS